MRTRYVAIALIFVCVSAFASERPYDIRHYDLLIKPDFARKSVTVRTRIEIFNPKLASQFEFGLSDGYAEVTAIANGCPAAIERAHGEISVKAAIAGKRTVLEIEARGLGGQSQGENRPIVDEHTLFLLWSDRFYPVDFDDWATVRTMVVVPKTFKVVAPGRLVRTSGGSGYVRYVFDTRRPTIAFSVFADSRWMQSVRVLSGLRIQTLLYPESHRFQEQIATTSSDVVKFYSSLFDGYPFDQFTFFTLDGMYARRAFPGAVGYAPQYLEREMTTTGHDAHETALLWWGYTTRGAGPGAWQWTEGLGDYAEILYDEARHKPVPAIFARFRQKYLAATDRDPLYRELRGNTPREFVHGKYPWVMAALREEVGDDAFSRGLRQLFQQYRYRTFTMEEFVGLFEQASGRDLKPWREQWLERRGAPPRSVEFRSESDLR